MMLKDSSGLKQRGIVSLINLTRRELKLSFEPSDRWWGASIIRHCSFSDHAAYYWDHCFLAAVGLRFHVQRKESIYIKRNPPLP
jgi:hypothetical protein